MSTIMSLFGKQTPFAGMQEHMRTVRDCSRLVVPLVEALVEGDQERLKDNAKQIFALEEEADRIKNDIRMHLPRSLFLPVDRRDLLQVLHAQDSIADMSEDIAGLFLCRDMPVHPDMRESLVALTVGCVGVVELTCDLIDHLDELVAVGFRGRTAAKVEELALALNEAENQTDKLERELRRILFTVEDEIGAVSVILWCDLIDWIGDLADYAEKVGNTVRLLIAR